MAKQAKDPNKGQNMQKTIPNERACPMRVKIVKIAN